MGANASTAVPVYASGQVLDAARLNLTNAGIPVFSGTATRDAAFGGSGEKVLAEGQVVYLEDTDALQYYSGSSFVAVGATPGLVCVKAETAFTTASSVTADSVFSSTYTNYRVLIRSTASSNEGMKLQYRVGGVTSTASNYNTQNFGVANTASAGDRSLNNSSASISGINGAFFSQYTLEISGPNLAAPTTCQSTSLRSDGAYTSPDIFLNYSNNTLSTAFDGLLFAPNAGTITGIYAIYAYSKTV
jgi:hypothetical protein